MNSVLDLQNLIKGFELSCQTEGKSPKTIEWYTCFLRRFLQFLQLNIHPTNVNEIESLRSLSVELYDSKLTAEEARQGHNIIKAFQKLGINPEQHYTLIKVCREVDYPGFVEAALKLAQIEAQTGMEYHQVMSGFEKAQKQLPRLDEKVAEIKAKLKSINDGLLENKQELVGQEEYLKKYQNEVKAKEAQLEKELAAKMKQLEVEKKEVEEVAALKDGLTKKGLNLQTVLKLVKEFRYGSKGD